MKTFIRSLLPEPILQAYHFVLAYAGAVLYGFPSRKLIVIAVTGTKGKSSTVELVAEMLRASGKEVASISTIRFSIIDKHERNLYKMTTPGRFFLQRFLSRAVGAGCTHAVIELTSEGALQYRHKGVALDALVFTNLQPEHLEASPKRPRIIVANADDAYGQKFLDAKAEVHASFSLKDAEPYTADDKS